MILLSWFQCKGFLFIYLFIYFFTLSVSLRDPETIHCGQNSHLDFSPRTINAISKTIILVSLTDTSNPLLFVGGLIKIKCILQ